MGILHYKKKEYLMQTYHLKGFAGGSTKGQITTKPQKGQVLKQLYFTDFSES